MRMEMPDRWTDVLDNPITFTWYNPTSATAPNSGALISRPALNQAYLNAYFAVVNNPANPHAINPATASAAYWPTDATFASTLTNYEGAECLYMMVSLGFVDELGGRDLFNESSIGDVDQDGFPEFLDAWGTPIRFLRWAPGFTDSELQGAGGIQILPNGGGSPTTSLTVIGSTNGIHSHGLLNRNNAYAGKTITVYTPHPSGTGRGTTQSATIASSSYVLSGTSTTTTFTLASPGLATARAGWRDIRNRPRPVRSASLLSLHAGRQRIWGNEQRSLALSADLLGRSESHVWNPCRFCQPAAAALFVALLLPIHRQQRRRPVDRPDDRHDDGPHGRAEHVSTWEANGWQDNIHNHFIRLR